MDIIKNDRPLTSVWSLEASSPHINMASGGSAYHGHPNDLGW